MELDIMVRERGGERRTWGPFDSFDFELPDIDGSWQAVLKCEGGYGKNHATGMTAIHHWRGNLREALWMLQDSAEAHYRRASDG